MTPRQLIEAAAAQFDDAGLFFGHGTESAVDEAAFIVMSVLGDAELSDDIVDKALPKPEREAIVGLFAERVATKKPAAYLLNEAWFAGLKFYVDERVLVPRSPIAEWLQRQFSPWVDPTKVRTILDIGTGSGCIAIAAAHYFEASTVVATDLSEEALAVARRNIEAHQVGDRVQTIRSDLFSQVNGAFDLIVSNPPYVDAEELARMPQEYHHEPAMALGAGEDGLLFARRIIDEARSFLTPDGVLVLEVGASREALIDAYPSMPMIELELMYGGEGLFLIEAGHLPG